MQINNIEENANIDSNKKFKEYLKEKLPEFFSKEIYNEDGELIKESGFENEKFNEMLEKNNINLDIGGYKLEFLGKDYAKKLSSEKPETIIVPNYIKNSKKYQNLYFTGDNIEVLKHLQNNYKNKVDIIYIDPPYNTGLDGFIYPDNFKFDDEQLKGMFNLNDEQLKKLKSIQGKATHSSWLTFMYPRLALAKTLLKESGIIFISIDDNEYSNLSLIMNEIFGEGNHLIDFTRISNKSGKSSDAVQTGHDYILTYGKNIAELNIIGQSNENDEKYDKSDEFYETRGKYRLNTPLDVSTLGYSSSLDYEILLNGDKYIAGSSEELRNKRLKGNHGRADWAWRWSKEKFEFGLKNGFIEIKRSNGNKRIYTKRYQNVDIEKKNGQYKVVNIKRTKPLSSLEFTKNEYSNVNATKRLDYLIGKGMFDYSKPVNLIKKLISLVPNKDATILDFFAGSGTTADATIQLNKEDNGDRKYILVQIPEKTYEIINNKEVVKKGSITAFNEGFKSIDEISRYRIDKVIDESKDDKYRYNHYYVEKIPQKTLDELTNIANIPMDLFSNMVEKFSAKSLGLSGEANGEHTIITTWLALDGFSFNGDIKEIKVNEYRSYKIDESVLYLVNEGWNSKNTRTLINMIGQNELNIQTVIIYGYSFDFEEIRELEIALSQLNNKVNLVKRF
ncbi:DNA methyltransferase [Staphylococcus xylosus]